jgi:ribosomal protein L12E/L44/L45/RPP1/RPP2
MTTRLVQKHLVKGSREFELVDDHVNIRIKAPFKDPEEITVMLTVLDPEPVISKSSLDFVSRVNGCTLISLLLGKPNTEEFNAFVSAVKQRALEEFSSFAGLTPPGPSSGAQANVYDEPPELEESAEERLVNSNKSVDPAKIESAIEMLKAQLDPEDIRPMVSALEELKEQPGNNQLLVQLLHAFNELGPLQGAVLAYAPYVNKLLTDSPFDRR